MKLKVLQEMRHELIILYMFFMISIFVLFMYLHTKLSALA